MNQLIISLILRSIIHGSVRTERKSNGFYIEAGALDGELHSNTLFFELHRNFSGMMCSFETSIYVEKFLRNL